MTNKIRRVREKSSGRIGTVTKTMGNCLWAKMDDDGTERSGAKQYWKTVIEDDKATPRYDRHDHLWVCDQCKEGSVNLSDFTHAATCPTKK